MALYTANLQILESDAFFKQFKIIIWGGANVN